MAHPIQRARQALRNAEAQTEQADGNQAEDDIEAGLGERPPKHKTLHTSPHLQMRLCLTSVTTPHPELCSRVGLCGFCDFCGWSKCRR